MQNFMRSSKLVLHLRFEQILMEKIRFKVTEGEICFATLYYLNDSSIDTKLSLFETVLDAFDRGKLILPYHQGSSWFTMKHSITSRHLRFLLILCPGIINVPTSTLDLVISNHEKNGTNS